MLPVSCLAVATFETAAQKLNLLNLSFFVLLLLLLLTGRLSLPSSTFCGSKLKLLTTSTGAKPSPARPGGSGRTSCKQHAVHCNESMQASGEQSAGAAGTGIRCADSELHEQQLCSTSQ
jgi:hypothetical protein